jgi:hypothetical protein
MWLQVFIAVGKFPGIQKTRFDNIYHFFPIDLISFKEGMVMPGGALVGSTVHWSSIRL